jgi:hypothetical protein
MYLTVKGLIAAFREEEHDSVQPYFWANTQLVRYVNEGLYRYAKMTMSFRDEVADMCSIDFAANDAEVPYDSRIFTIVRAKLNGVDLEVRADYPNDTTGVPVALEVNTASKWLRLRPTPIAGGTVALTVIRAPLAMATDNSAISDVPPENQHVLMSWVKSRAFLVGDAEVFNAEKSKTYADEFESETKRIYEETLSRHRASSNTTRFKW